jgi:hypothetical protein
MSEQLKKISICMKFLYKWKKFCKSFFFETKVKILKKKIKSIQKVKIFCQNYFLLSAQKNFYLLKDMQRTRGTFLYIKNFSFLVKNFFLQQNDYFFNFLRSAQYLFFLKEFTSARKLR